ncbi:DUF3999 family protein [Sinomicrobium soli]|uniref:DUF3999 family protein n=1 Tax=Sinomicrobium sp. N-1-3-6 TaxID=2219864 RepID=UPI001F4463CB|nr:DUF3999 family protein [Sinomicrobium sp. N-1-3-6]
MCYATYGQIGQYDYKRELKGVSEQWHKIVLPDEVFGKVSGNLDDIRIYGVTKNNDTVEAPYMLRLTGGKKSVRKIGFRRLNTVSDNKGYYFTFEVPGTETVNRIKLDFKQENFDWRVTLEGSQDQRQWFTVSENYRILSIQNETTDFQSTTLAFPESKYRYLRVFIDSEEKPDLLEAGMERMETTEGVFRDYLPRKTDIREDRASGQTGIDIDLPFPVPVSRLLIDVGDRFDYYRPLTIRYVADSVKTEQGWKYQYHTLASGTLNSMDNNEFTFRSTIVKKLNVLIDNHDNQPLDIDGVQVKGYLHELVVRFAEPAAYFLVYGSTPAVHPNYDIGRFADRIPVTLTPLEAGEEEVMAKERVKRPSPLFENKVWLWAVMLVIIVTLGWFSVNMMRKNGHSAEK